MFQTETQIRESLVEIYRQKAKSLGIKAVTGNWMGVDGLEFTIGKEGSVTSTVPRNTDRDVFNRRLSQVGTFSTNGRLIGFVDGEGRMNVGLANPENKRVLGEAGYIRGAINVPFSSGQRPVDSQMVERLEKLKHTELMRKL